VAETKAVGVPSVKGMKDSFTDFALGAAGGLVYALTSAIFGSGMIGALAAPVLAGSIIKGTRGTVLSTIAGFMLLSGMFNTGTAQAASGANEGVM